MFEVLPTAPARAALYPWGVKPPAVMLIGKNAAEATLASAALYCAGARIVNSAPDLAVVIESKSAARQPLRLGVPRFAIVPPGYKPKALAAGLDASYARPATWKAYSRPGRKLL